MITQEELKKILFYDEHTGLFRWIYNSRNKIKAGDIAGSKYSNGYIVIKINGKRYGAHRLAYLYKIGILPDHKIDHINHIKHDNAWNNIRPATNSENMQNQIKAPITNESGYLGVRTLKTMKRIKRYAANITKDGKTYSLGVYLTPEEAHEVYVKHKRILHEFGTL